MKQGTSGVFAWRDGSKGQLGLGDFSSSLEPRLLEDLVGFDAVRIFSRGNFTAAISSRGELFTWGNGDYGQLAHGQDINVSIRPRAVKACPPEGFAQVACGWSHIVAVTKSGALYSWGNGAHGNLGIGELQAQEHFPRLIEGVAGVLYAACGYRHSACISEQGQLIVWGDNEYGQLGLGRFGGTPLSNPTPLPEFKGRIVRQVECGALFTIVLTGFGEVFTFGRGMEGQLGHGDGLSKSTPTKVLGLQGHNVVKIAAGAQQSLAMTASGEVFFWGLGGNVFEKPARQLLTSAFNEPTKASFLASRKIVDITTGEAIAAALDDEGSVVLWNPSEAWLAPEARRDPLPIACLTLKDCKKIACGEAHVVAIAHSPTSVLSGQFGRQSMSADFKQATDLRQTASSPMRKPNSRSGQLVDRFQQLLSNLETRRASRSPHQGVLDRRSPQRNSQRSPSHGQRSPVREQPTQPIQRVTPAMLRSSRSPITSTFASPISQHRSVSPAPIDPTLPSSTFLATSRSTLRELPSSHDYQHQYTREESGSIPPEWKDELEQNGWGNGLNHVEDLIATYTDNLALKSHWKRKSGEGVVSPTPINPNAKTPSPSVDGLLSPKQAEEIGAEVEEKMPQHIVDALQAGQKNADEVKIADDYWRILRTLREIAVFSSSGSDFNELVTPWAQLPNAQALLTELNSDDTLDESEKLLLTVQAKKVLKELIEAAEYEAAEQKLYSYKYWVARRSVLKNLDSVEARSGESILEIVEHIKRLVREVKGDYDPGLSQRERDFFVKDLGELMVRLNPDASLDLWDRVNQQLDQLQDIVGALNEKSVEAGGKAKALDGLVERWKNDPNMSAEQKALLIGGLTGEEYSPEAETPKSLKPSERKARVSQLWNNVKTMQDKIKREAEVENQKELALQKVQARLAKALAADAAELRASGSPVNLDLPDVPPDDDEAAGKEGSPATPSTPSRGALVLKELVSDLVEEVGMDDEGIATKVTDAKGRQQRLLQTNSLLARLKGDKTVDQLNRQMLKADLRRLKNALS